MMQSSRPTFKTSTYQYFVWERVCGRTLPFFQGVDGDLVWDSGFGFGQDWDPGTCLHSGDCLWAENIRQVQNEKNKFIRDMHSTQHIIHVY